MVLFFNGKVLKVEQNAGLEHIQSEALLLNMPLTNVPVEIEPLFGILEEIVAAFSGKRQQAHQLLVEYHHKYRNWHFVVQETWRYAVANIRIYRDHSEAGRVVYLLSQILLEALEQSQQSVVRALAADHLLAFWLKLIEEMPAAIARPLPEDCSPATLDQRAEAISACHEGILRYFFKRLANLEAEPFQFLMKSFFQPKRVATELLRIWPAGTSYAELRPLLRRLLEETYQMWLQSDDPCVWLRNQEERTAAAPPWLELCARVGHGQYRSYLQAISSTDNAVDNRATAAQLAQLPDYQEIVHTYQQLPQELKAFDRSTADSHLSMLMRLKIMETKGLESIHEETLREINLDLTQLIRNEPMDTLQIFLTRVFEVLEGSLRSYPEAALQCVRTIGLEILETDNHQLIEFFLRRIIAMGFQLPKLGGVSQHWQIQVNAAHLLNVRIWLEFIKKNPKATKSLLSALIVNLSLGGICIRDTDLFQKDVSQLLHS